MKPEILQFFAPSPECPEGCSGSHCHCQSCGEPAVPLTDDDVCEVCVLTTETCPDELPNDLGFWHDWLVHSDGSRCEDGCSKAAIPVRAEAYRRIAKNLWDGPRGPGPGGSRGALEIRGLHRRGVGVDGRGQEDGRSEAVNWKTKDGREIQIKDMDDTHLWNTITMLRRRVLEKVMIIRRGDIPPWMVDQEANARFEVFKDLIAEAVRRKMLHSDRARIMDDHMLISEVRRALVKTFPDRAEAMAEELLRRIAIVKDYRYFKIIPPGERPCVECNSIGFVNSPCDECDGNGHVPDFRPMVNYGRRELRDDCVICQNEGPHDVSDRPHVYHR